jgi:hypothetical protein
MSEQSEHLTKCQKLFKLVVVEKNYNQYRVLFASNTVRLLIDFMLQVGVEKSIVNASRITDR